MKIKQIARMSGAQDGAIWGNLLFRFNARGEGKVYDLSRVAEDVELTPVATLTLDRAEEIAPHSNAVCFGTEFAEEGDEFPLLYSNIYNNYQKCEERREGECCVYRLRREGDGFVTTLVQLIRIGFVENSDLWCSADVKDVRPYGNFTVDRERGLYWAYVMRDGSRTTRYFSFRLPKLSDGETDAALGIPCVTLTPDDILSQFDCDYHDYVQGGCCHNGRIYSVEGFHADGKHPPAIRVIDTVGGRELICEKLADHGCLIEPECIDFCGDVCYYSDAHGALYTIDFS